MSGRTPSFAAPERFVKRADDAAHAARLRRQAELLAIGQFSGVVRLVALEGLPDDPVLITTRVDGPDLARRPELTVDEVAGLVVELARTLADLHDHGVVHGAVMAEHVLLSSDGRPVLCGFGYGARTGEPPVAEGPLPDPAVDPARARGAPLSPASDVFALGALLDRLLDTAGRATSSQTQVHALRAVAARALVADPALRPSARSIAEAVRHAAPSACLPGRVPFVTAGLDGRDATARDLPEPEMDAERALRAGPALQALRGRGGATHLPVGRRRHSPKAIAGLVLLTVPLVGLVVRASTGGSARPRSEVDVPTSASAPSTSLPAPHTAVPETEVPPPPTTGAVPAGCPAVTALLAADTDADGCPEVLRWEAGVVEAGDRRWSVGQPGDVAVTGDWACAGVATLAVLRPSTGQVFVFDGWATLGHDLSAPQALRVEGGFALRAAELDADPCPDLVVERAGRPPATVPLAVDRP
jgi:hypothetical protein